MLTVKLTTTAKPGPGKKALETLLGLDDRAVFAGLFDEVEATKGHAHEFGTAKIRARPWASVAADEGTPALGAAAAREIAAVADGRSTGDQALDELGALAAQQLGAVITSGRVGGPELSTTTKDRKGHDVKLLDSGDMLGAITHQIDDGTVDADG